MTRVRMSTTNLLYTNNARKIHDMDMHTVTFQRDVVMIEKSHPVYISVEFEYREVQGGKKESTAKKLPMSWKNDAFG